MPKKQDTVKLARETTQVLIDSYNPDDWNCNSVNCKSWMDCDYCHFDDMDTTESSVHKIFD